MNRESSLMYVMYGIKCVCKNEYMYRESGRGIVSFQCDTHLLSEVDKFYMGVK